MLRLAGKVCLAFAAIAALLGFSNSGFAQGEEGVAVSSLSETAAVSARSGAAHNDARTMFAAAQIMITVQRASPGLGCVSGGSADPIRPGQPTAAACTGYTWAPGKPHGSLQNPGEKSPVSAGVLSLFIPGAGSFYAGNTGHGIRHLVLVPAIIGVTIVGLYAANQDGGELEAGEAYVALAGLAALAANSIWSIVTAVNDAKAHNRTVTTAGQSPPDRPAPERTLSLQMGLTSLDRRSAAIAVWVSY